VGAGAFEAALLGLWSMIQATILSLMPTIPDQAAVMLGYMAGATPAIAFIGPTERIIAILSHIGARTLVLYGVAVRRKALAWMGFWLLTLVDSVAGWFYLTGYVGGHNMWLVELSIAPLGILGALATAYCVNRWPAEPAVEVTAVEEHKSQVEGLGGMEKEA
jgi:hypothetical protein